MDWEGVRPSEEFIQAIYGAIEGVDTFAFVLTPDSFVSGNCGREIAHAVYNPIKNVPGLRSVSSCRVITVADEP